MFKRAARLVVVASVAAAFVALVSAPAQAADRDPSSVLVKFSIPSQLSGALAAYGDRVGARLDDNVVLVRLPAGSLRRHGRQPLQPAVRRRVRRAELHRDGRPPSPRRTTRRSAASGTSGRSPPSPAGRASSRRRTRRRSTAPSSPCVDTGVQANHPDLNGRVLAGANCLTGSCIAGNSDDDNDHGTHVVGHRRRLHQQRRRHRRRGADLAGSFPSRRSTRTGRARTRPSPPASTGPSPRAPR